MMLRRIVYCRILILLDLKLEANYLENISFKIHQWKSWLTHHKANYNSSTRENVFDGQKNCQVAAAYAGNSRLETGRYL